MLHEVIREVIGDRSLREIGSLVGSKLGTETMAASTVHAWTADPGVSPRAHAPANNEVLAALLDVCEATADQRRRAWTAFGVPTRDLTPPAPAEA